MQHRSDQHCSSAKAQHCSRPSRGNGGWHGLHPPAEPFPSGSVALLLAGDCFYRLRTDHRRGPGPVSGTEGMKELPDGRPFSSQDLLLGIVNRVSVQGILASFRLSASSISRPSSSILAAQDSSQLIIHLRLRRPFA